MGKENAPSRNKGGNSKYKFTIPNTKYTFPKYLLKVARFKSATRDKKGDTPVRQNELPSLAPNACIGETVWLKT